MPIQSVAFGPRCVVFARRFGRYWVEIGQRRSQLGRGGQIWPMPGHMWPSTAYFRRTHGANVWRPLPRYPGGTVHLSPLGGVGQDISLAWWSETPAECCRTSFRGGTPCIRSDNKPPRGQHNGCTSGQMGGLSSEGVQHAYQGLTPWQQVAQDKQVLQQLEAFFAQRLLPQHEVSVVPHGRWVIGDTPPL